MGESEVQCADSPVQQLDYGQRVSTPFQELWLISVRGSVSFGLTETR